MKRPRRPVGPSSASPNPVPTVHAPRRSPNFGSTPETEVESRGTPAGSGVFPVQPTRGGFPVVWGGPAPGGAVPAHRRRGLNVSRGWGQKFSGLSRAADLGSRWRARRKVAGGGRGGRGIKTNGGFEAGVPLAVAAFAVRDFAVPSRHQCTVLCHCSHGLHGGRPATAVSERSEKTGRRRAC